MIELMGGGETSPRRGVQHIKQDYGLPADAHVEPVEIVGIGANIANHDAMCADDAIDIHGHNCGFEVGITVFFGRKLNLGFKKYFS